MIFPPTENLNDLYSTPALRVLLETVREGFHALVYRAGQNGDFAFLERALDVVKPAHLKMSRFSSSLLGSSLEFTPGAADDQVRLPTETLTGSFLRGLRGRPFGDRETAFVDLLLSKAVAGNPGKSTASVYSDALVRLLSVGVDNAANAHLIGLGASPFGSLEGTPVKASGRDMNMNTLGMAIIMGNEPMLRQILGRAPDPQNQSSKSWTDGIAVETDPNGGTHSKKSYTALDSIIFFADPATVPAMLRAYHDHSKLTTESIDAALLNYIAQVRPDAKREIAYQDHWSRPLNQEGWNEDIVNTMLSYREPGAKFSDALLMRAMDEACYPVVEAALQSGQNFASLRSERNPHVRVNCAKAIASANAPIDRISRSLAAAIAGGADVNQYTNDTTALIDAAKCNRLEAAGVLLQHGADPLATDSRNWKAASNFKDRVQRAQFERMVKSINAQRSIEAVLKAKLSSQP